MRNYYKLAWRNLVKNKQFTLLNLLGLSTGLACVFMIWLWVSDELRKDKYNEHDEQIYQVLQNAKSADKILTLENTPGLLANALAAEMPEVRYAAAVIPPSWFSEKTLFSVDQKNIRANAQFVSKDYFNIFSVDFINGEKDDLFNASNNVAISETLAFALFNSTDVIGKLCEWNEKNLSGSYLITGVFKPLPGNATARFEALFNYELFLNKNPKLQNWGNADPSTFVLLKENTDPQYFNNKIAGFLKTKNEKTKSTLLAQKFSDKYLYNRYDNGRIAGGRIEYLKLFSIIAIFILLIACINFINLSVTAALSRAKETGIRKVIGAKRISLFIQYIGESLLMVIVAVIIASGFVLFFFPAVEKIAGGNIAFHFEPGIVIAMISMILITAIVAGGYPAFYLSGFRPAQVLKGNAKNISSDSWLRKGLVIFQFSISIILIISVLVVYRQMKLIQHADIGYDRSQLIYFYKGGKLPGNKDDFKEGGPYQKDLETFMIGIRNVSGVINVANFRHNVVDRNGGTTDVNWQGKPADDETSFTDIAAGYDFIETMDIKMLEGRTFSKNYTNERSKVIVNEAAIEAMGITNPVGKTLKIWGEDREIIGVTKNFHFQSLYETIKPCFFDFNFSDRSSKLVVKINKATAINTITQLQKFYKAYTGEALEYKFLEDDYQALYASENRVATLAGYFAIIAIVISCLGLFGLSAYTVLKRQKEIGVRKIVGASVTSIATLLSFNFLKLVLIAFAIASPLAWFASEKWLQGFAYRVNLNAGLFIIAGAFILFITLSTISFQVIKAAMVNPIKTLRSE